MQVELLVLGKDDLLELVQMLVDQGVVKVGLLWGEGGRYWQGLAKGGTEQGVETLNGEWETWRGLELKSLANICNLCLRSRRARR